MISNELIEKYDLEYVTKPDGIFYHTKNEETMKKWQQRRNSVNIFKNNIKDFKKIMLKEFNIEVDTRLNSNALTIHFYVSSEMFKKWDDLTNDEKYKIGLLCLTSDNYYKSIGLKYRKNNDLDQIIKFFYKKVYSRQMPDGQLNDAWEPIHPGVTDYYNDAFNFAINLLHSWNCNADGRAYTADDYSNNFYISDAYFFSDALAPDDFNLANTIIETELQRLKNS